MLTTDDRRAIEAGLGELIHYIAGEHPVAADLRALLARHAAPSPLVSHHPEACELSRQMLIALAREYDALDMCEAPVHWRHVAADLRRRVAMLPPTPEPVPAPAPVFVIGQRVRVRATGAHGQVLRCVGPIEPKVEVAWEDGVRYVDPSDLEPVPDDPRLTTHALRRDGRPDAGCLPECKPCETEAADDHATNCGGLSECYFGDASCTVYDRPVPSGEIRAEWEHQRKTTRITGASPAGSYKILRFEDTAAACHGAVTINRAIASAKAQAREEALRQAARAARNARLPAGYDYGDDALRTFIFGKDRAADAILALIGEPASSEPEPRCSLPHFDKDGAEAMRISGIIQAVEVLDECAKKALLPQRVGIEMARERVKALAPDVAWPEPPCSTCGGRRRVALDDAHEGCPGAGCCDKPCPSCAPVFGGLKCSTCGGAGWVCAHLHGTDEDDACKRRNRCPTCSTPAETPAPASVPRTEEESGDSPA
jgi:hypothetical protein